MRSIFSVPKRAPGPKIRSWNLPLVHDACPVLMTCIRVLASPSETMWWPGKCTARSHRAEIASRNFRSKQFNIGRPTMRSVTDDSKWCANTWPNASRSSGYFARTTPALSRETSPSKQSCVALIVALRFCPKPSITSSPQMLGTSSSPVQMPNLWLCFMLASRFHISAAPTNNTNIEVPVAPCSMMSSPGKNILVSAASASSASGAGSIVEKIGACCKAPSTDAPLKAARNPSSTRNFKFSGKSSSPRVTVLRCNALVVHKPPISFTFTIPFGRHSMPMSATPPKSSPGTSGTPSEAWLVGVPVLFFEPLKAEFEALMLDFEALILELTAFMPVLEAEEGLVRGLESKGSLGSWIVRTCPNRTMCNESWRM
mmetsp:Transcript_95144/g.275065  ORF Transcript_95144/g.275065 Transcript_95144/m.275065 type:complete len:371 (+) Transcript_95144:818-1930(+)